MSFLDESSGSVEDVLAFIDACDSATGAPSPTQSRTKRRDKRGLTVAPRRCRSQSYRIREEIQLLSREAHELEARIHGLKFDLSYEQKLIKLNALNAQAHRSKRWIENVLREYRRRQEAERTNRQLKALLAKQMRTIRATETAFGVFTQAEIAMAFNSPSALKVRRPGDGQIMAALGERLQQLQMNVDNVIDRRAAEDSVSSLHNPASNFGACFESCSSSPLPTSMELMQTMFDAIYSHKVAKPYAELLGRDVKTTKTKQLQHQRQSHQLVTKTRMRMIDRSDCVACVRASLTSQASQCLSFVEENIFVLIPAAESTASQKPGTILINWFRVQVQHHDLPSTLEQSLDLDTFKQNFMSLSIQHDVQHLHNLKNYLCEGNPDLN